MLRDAYYNEIDPYAAQWLRNLIDAGHIARGDVDERSIVDVQPSDIAGYVQCHFFAGFGGWPRALRIAGIADSEPVWTGSCPCQPLSSAGQRKGHADERHLWPAFYGLIAQRSPAIIFGEQVASKDGREWLSGVRADLETLGYASGAADLCAAGAGAPQIRQRLYWMAHSKSLGSWPTQPRDSQAEAKRGWAHDPSSDRRFSDGAGNIYRIPESEVPFVVDGFPGILDQIRAIGNAIYPPLGAEFIRASAECFS